MGERPLDTVITTAIADLHESDENPREITDERFDALKYAISKDPQMLKARPIIVTPDGAVICGNMRLRAIKELGWTEAPVFFHEFASDAEKREWMLRDNQEYGDWVPDELATMIAAHRDDEADMKMLGFGEPQIDSLLKQADGEPDVGGGGDGGMGQAEVWGIVVECDSEDQQSALMEELADRGLEVRALIPV